MTVPNPAIALALTPEVTSPVAKGTDTKNIEKTAQEFEAVFLSQMFSHMFTGIGSSGLFGGGSSEETYRTMMYQELGTTLSKAGGIGIADSVMRHMLKQQEI
jgi:Rod binding domain-containing protein